MNYKEKELITLLKNVYDDSDFVYGILDRIPNEDSREEMIEYLKRNEHISSSYVVMKAFCIANGIQPEKLK